MHDVIVLEQRISILKLLIVSFRYDVSVMCIIIM